MTFWIEKDKSQALCPKCNEIVVTEFRFGQFILTDINKTVDNVLLGYCTICDTVVSVPAQSLPQIQQERSRGTSLHDDLP